MIPDIQIYSARGFLEKSLQPDTSAPLIINGISGRKLAGEIRARLLHYYNGGEQIFFGHGEPITGGAELRGPSEEIPLNKIDCQKNYGADTYAFILAQKDFEKRRYGYADLMRVMARLTAPDGCPWDREQTHASIAKNAIEEANELVEAIRANDTKNIMEEAGDVILQGVFHGTIAEHNGTFTSHDVIDTLCKKLISRHTHVFGADKAENPDEALGFWKAAKKKEKP